MLTILEKTNVNEVYEEIAEHFHVTRVNKWSWVEDFLNKLKKDSLVLDLGCGNGRNMNHENIKFIGVDNCTKFVEICNKKGLDVINCNMTNVKLENDKVDAIICIAVFHHLSTKENRVDALREMKRLVKPGGKILLSVWSINQPQKTRRKFNNYGNNIVIWNSYNKTFERYYYIFKIDEIKKLFQLVGLSLLNYEYNCGNEIFTLIRLQ